MAENIIGAPKAGKPRVGGRTGLRFLGLAAVLSLLIWAGFQVSAYRNFMHDLNTYQGVSLGDSMDC